MSTPARAKHKISDDHRRSPKHGYHKLGVEGYTHNNDFVFSDDIADHKFGKTRRNKKYPDLF